MTKLTIEGLEKIKEKASKTTALRDGNNTVKITVPLSTCGIQAGAKDIITTLMEEIEKADRFDIKVISSGCLGFCETEPNVKVEILDEPPIVYQHVDKNKMCQIFKNHILKGEVQTEFILDQTTIEKEAIK